MKARLFLALWLAGSLASATTAAERGDRLYRMTLLRAAPGRLAEALAAARERLPGLGPRTLLLRHSQGDQWDLMLLQWLPSYAEHLKTGAPAPLVPSELVAFQEDEFVRGPELGELAGFLDAGLYHAEMFHALAGRRDELLREREMENAYARELGRPVTAIFVRELGAGFDAFTLGAFKSWTHYAERDGISKERSLAAAKAAGFASDEAIGPYLRSLILDHHDTLATPVRP